MNKEINTGKTFDSQFDFYYKEKFEKWTWYGKTKEEEFKHFLEIFPNIKKNEKILNAGFGNHTLLQSLGENYPTAEVYGIDACDIRNVKERLKDFKNIKIIQSVILDMPFQDNYFDKIWCCGVLHHTENPRKNFDELVKVLKNKGEIYIFIYRKKFNFYLELRRIFKNSHKWNRKKQYYISYIIAVLFYPIIFLKNIKTKPSLRTIAYYIYDSLSPQYNWRFDEKEIKEWFEQNNLEFKNLGNGEYLGIKNN
ncbi:hypothetical protein CO154_01300 [Candidatus Pacearchaeota archaeon CG_4_9_14_3_um_filter_31_7]|nr:MAG: hypothetical protein CO154_01300 [Candidatus Pacearchaeota archaeon CG_4_9_14_3_um_filter_31_7]